MSTVVPQAVQVWCGTSVGELAIWFTVSSAARHEKTSAQRTKFHDRAGSHARTRRLAPRPVSGAGADGILAFTPAGANRSWLRHPEWPAAAPARNRAPRRRGPTAHSASGED